MDVIKASGEKEKFNQEKLYQSLKRAGARAKLAERVSEEISRKVYPGMESGEIFNGAIHCLRKEDPAIAARYNLKRAIMELGPSGYSFEKYVAEILKEYGYTTEVGKLVQGHCVTHEVDVVARKENNHFMIECKYHNSRGIRSDLKVALYTFARFLDIKQALEERPAHRYFFHQAWLVTNTKCTSQAVNYAKCAGLKIISWRYPKGESLEYLIEKKNLYPITVLLSIPRFLKERLIQKGIVLVRDLLKYTPQNFARIIGVKPNVVLRIQEEAEKLCPC